MNEFDLKEASEKLESVFLNIIYLRPEERLVAPNMTHLTSIKDCLNNIFKDEMECTCLDVLYANNTDNQFFGIKINPVIDATTALKVLTTDERTMVTKYQIEFDSKIFDINLDAEEILALTLFEISSMIGSYEVFDKVRALIDLHVLSNDDVISIRDSINYHQLIIYAIKDTLYKVSSALFKEDPEELTCNGLIQTLELQDPLLSAQEKIMTSVYGVGEVVRSPKTIILRWMFMIYKDMQHNSSIVMDTLKDAKQFTASKLEQIEIDKTIKAVDRIGDTIMEGKNLDKALEAKGLYSVCEISLFKSLKEKGLRGIENDLYEYAVRIKNCETEEDAMYILRCINTRLGILEDYIYNSPDLSESEKAKWTAVANNYRALREQLTKKKIWSKSSYGLFIDYNQLDKLDE